MLVSLAISFFASSILLSLLCSPIRAYRLIADVASGDLAYAWLGILVLVNSTTALIVHWKRKRTYFNLLCRVYHAMALMELAAFLILHRDLS